MSVTLVNQSGRMRVFTLPHDSYCKERKACACVSLFGRDDCRLPTSLIIPAGERVSGLEDAILSVADIARAVRRGELRVERYGTPEPALQPELEDTRRPSRKNRGEA